MGSSYVDVKIIHNLCVKIVDGAISALPSGDLTEEEIRDGLIATCQSILEIGIYSGHPLITHLSSLSDPALVVAKNVIVRSIKDMAAVAAKRIVRMRASHN